MSRVGSPGKSIPLTIGTCVGRAMGEQTHSDLRDLQYMIEKHTLRGSNSTDMYLNATLDLLMPSDGPLICLLHNRAR